jgi:hypothetical protein
MEWYLVIDGVRRGPMSKASVLTLIAKGVVTPNTPARRPGMPEWLAIRHLKEFDLSPPAVAPLPAAPPLPPAATTNAAPTKSMNPLLAYFRRHWRGQ